MTRRVVGRFGRLALGFSPVIIALAGFIGLFRWMQPSPVAAGALTAVFAIFVLGYSLFLGNRESRRLDEVQRASLAFASANGWVWGGFATIVLLMVPAFMDGLVDLVNALASRHGNVPPDMTNHLAMRMAVSLGIVLVMVMQTLAIVVFSIVWHRRMGGSGESS